MGSELSRRGFLELASLAGLGSVVVPQGVEFLRPEKLESRRRLQDAH